jgi:enoyl-CoA hydratase/carnithine racemase
MSRDVAGGLLMELCMPHPHVVVERSAAGYLRLLLARPDRRNALDPGMVRALMHAFRAEPAALVILGSTDPQSFCAGADLAISDAKRSEVSDLLYECYEVMITRPGPVIAVIRGPAVGGGAQLATAADLRIASPAARMRWAGPPGRDLSVGAWLLPDLVGRGAAMELAMTGRWVDAAEALRLGLLDRVDDEPEQAAASLAEALLTRGAGALANVKMVTSAGDLLDRLHAERDANRAAWTHPLPGPPERG